MSQQFKSGFTLVEIVLALLVASIGLLGVFSLFPAGVQMNKTALDETQAALFAEQVLNGVRAQASTTRWDRIKGGIDLPPPTPDVWNNPNGLRVRQVSGAAATDTNKFYTLRYDTVGMITGGTEAYTDFGVRYRLEVFDVDEYRKSVRLLVRPGEYGSDKSYVFYTELYNHGHR